MNDLFWNNKIQEDDSFRGLSVLNLIAFTKGVVEVWLDFEFVFEDLWIWFENDLDLNVIWI